MAVEDLTTHYGAERQCAAGAETGRLAGPLQRATDQVFRFTRKDA
jgi:hypothetical protein